MTVRVIARVETKGTRAVKGVRCEGVRGLEATPAQLLGTYYDAGADEVFLQDVTNSLYGLPPNYEQVDAAMSHCFVPVTVAGGVRCAEHVRTLTKAGAERVAINTGAVRDPALIESLAARFGCSTVSLLVEAKRTDWGWECYTDGGREPSGFDAIAFVLQCAPHVAEVIVCSVDRDGTREGYDLELLRRVVESAPHAHVIACGGFGVPEHAVEAARVGVSGVAIATALHRGTTTIKAVKDALGAAGYRVRREREDAA